MGLDKYFADIKDRLDKGTEHTLRSYLESVLNEFASGVDSKIEVIHEPTNQEGKGRPDFKISKSGLTIGYVETKAFKGASLDEVLESQQIKNYSSISGNIILTNYAEFILIRNGAPQLREVLFYPHEKKLDSSRKSKVEAIFGAFFDFNVEPVKKPENLSSLLAKRTRLFKGSLLELLKENNSSNFIRMLLGENGLFDIFKSTLIADLSLDEFADIYAQTITYGLFMAKLNAEGKIARKTAFAEIPNSLGVIREMFESMKPQNIPDEIAWVVDEIVDVLNNLSPDFHKEMSYNTKAREGEETHDPYIHFYEKFLSEYDKEKRKAKGVYYTPLPVVQFIVNSIDGILRRDFCAKGFQDSKVNVLDFACGTGTFLLEAIKKSLSDIEPGSKPSFIRGHILQNFYGFEYMVAPYTVAHLKLSQFIEQHNFKFGDSERLKVYLTDTLDDQKHKQSNLFPEISAEGEEANKVKTGEPILVVMGNPPYSNYSRNNKPFILELIKAYKEGLNEKKTNLNDDYIKFIRYAQCKIEGAKYGYDTREGKEYAKMEGHINSLGKGIVGIITNNSYLDGITHRIMRKSLFGTFDKIYILNLHGNSIKGEGDKNVFDIMVGVSIILLVKLDKPQKEKEVYYYSTLESGIASREDKYKLLSEHGIETLDWKRLSPKEPNWWFVDKDLGLEEEYKTGKSLTEIFSEYGSGVGTDRDELFIDHNAVKLADRIKTLLSKKYDENFVEQYNVRNSSSYNLLDKIANKSFVQSSVKSYLYRPFDKRFIYYETGITSRPAFDIERNLMIENYGILTSRMLSGNSFKHIFITENLNDRDPLSARTSERSYVFPLYLYPDTPKGGLYEGDGEQSRKVNFNPGFLEFVRALEARYGMRYVADGKGTVTSAPSPQPSPKGGGGVGSHDNSVGFNLPPQGEGARRADEGALTFGPEDIMAYIYAILHSDRYRKRYFEFLKIDFPRIPFFDANVFAKLSRLGAELIGHHLLKTPYQLEISKEDKGAPKVEKIEYNKESKKIHINPTYYFEHIEPEVWEFEIGGYQVISKWLKERKSMTLDYKDIDHVKNIAKSLGHTIRIMAEIDSVFCENGIFTD